MAPPSSKEGGPNSTSMPMDEGSVPVFQYFPVISWWLSLAGPNRLWRLSGRLVRHFGYSVLKCWQPAFNNSICRLSFPSFSFSPFVYSHSLVVVGLSSGALNRAVLPDVFSKNHCRRRHHFDDPICLHCGAPFAFSFV